MANLARRLSVLEGGGAAQERAHIIFLDDRSEDDAVATYEAEHGTVAGDLLMLVQFIE